MASPESDPDESGWGVHALARERATFLVANALTAGLIALWSVADAIFEPALVVHFLGYRALCVGVALAALVVIRGSQSSRRSRWAMTISAFVAGLAISATMLPRVEHYSLYAFGLSILFWGCGCVLVWPARYTLLMFAAVICAYVATNVLVRPRSITEEESLGWLVFYVSAAAIGTANIDVRRRLERRAYSASAELAQRNRQLARTLATLQDTQARLVATEKLSALGRLLAQLSHEINNPVNVLQNNLEPLGRYFRDLEVVLDAARQIGGAASSAAGAGGIRDAASAMAAITAIASAQREVERLWERREIDFVRSDLPDALDTMATAVNRIRAVQADLRSFMRGDAPVMEAGDVNDGLRRTVHMLTRTLPPGVSLAARYGDLPSARFQPGQLNQVFLNLLQNALDAVGERGEIVVSSEVAEDAIRISIADDGPGVPAEARSRLFEPFFTTKQVGSGTGLGLAICYQIMARHGGSIRLDESHACGAKFVVSLPIHGGDEGRMRVTEA